MMNFSLSEEMEVIFPSSLLSQNATSVPDNGGGRVYDNNTYLTNKIKPYGGFFKQDAEPYEVYIASVTLVSDIGGAFSTIGNLLTIYILSQATLSHSVASIFLRYLATNDLLVAIVFFFPFFGDIFPSSNFFCRGHRYGQYLFSQLSSLVLIPISLERLVAVYLPLRVKDVFTRKRAMVILIAITIVFASADMFAIFAVGIIETKHSASGFSCIINPKLRPYFMSVYLWFDFSTYFLIPFLVTLTCNIAIISRIIQQRRLRSRLTNAPSDGGFKISSTTWALLGINLVFIVLVSPRTLTLPFLNPMELSSMPKDEYIIARSALVSIRNLAVFNNFINFLVYCITMPKFRLELKNLFSCRKCRS